MSDAPLDDRGDADEAEPKPFDIRGALGVRRLKWTGIGLLIAIVVVVGAVFGYSTYRNDQIHHIAVKNLSNPESNGVENILLIGSTSRCALKVQNAAFGTCAGGVTGINSDVIMVLRLDPNHKRVSLLSFPRDTFLPNARPGETNRIDSALLYGPSQLVAVIEQDFGIPINHFVELNFDSFQGVINALGGIDMYFPDPVKDAYSTLNIKKTGCVHLNGFEALAVVRARHMQYEVNGQWYYDGSGDLGRIERDHEFLRVLASALSKRSLNNPLTDNSLFGSIAPQLEVDNGFSLRDMVSLVLTYHGVNTNNAPQFTLPVRVDPSSTYTYKGADYGYIVFPTEPQDQITIRRFLSGSTPTKSLKTTTVNVYVEGGIGSPSATASFAAKLAQLGYSVKGTEEVPPVGPVSETDVLYTPGHLAQGERVLNSLSGAVALGEQTSTNGADVTVVLGSNGAARSPNTAQSSATSTTTLKSAPVTTLSALITATLTQALEAPTPSHEALASYDPRACPIKHAKKTKNPKKKAKS